MSSSLRSARRRVMRGSTSRCRCWPFTFSVIACFFAASTLAALGAAWARPVVRATPPAAALVPRNPRRVSPLFLLADGLDVAPDVLPGVAPVDSSVFGALFFFDIVYLRRWGRARKAA